MYRYIICLIASVLFTCTAWCDTVSLDFIRPFSRSAKQTSSFCSRLIKRFDFPSNCDTLRHGNVICPKEKDKKTIIIYVNHRMSNSKQNFEFYSELTDKLLCEGISCCYYDNRPTLFEDSTTTTTMFDMADDAAAVYRALKKNKRYRNYRIGFYGVSEAGGSALIAASMVPNPAFVIQQFTCVIPDIEKFFLNITVYQQILTAAFIHPKGFDMPYYRFASMMREIFETLRDNQVNDTNAYVQTIIKKYFSDLSEDKKEWCVRILSEYLGSFKKLGIVDRLNRNARPYYQNIKCPILYIGGLKDTNVLGIPNLVEFEKIMLENGHKKFNTILFNLNHQMLTSQEVFEEHYRQKEPVGVKRPFVWDSIKRWILSL